MVHDIDYYGLGDIKPCELRGTLVRILLLTTHL